MHARIGSFRADVVCQERVLAFFGTEAVAAFARHDGFLGYQAFVDRSDGRIVGISYWTDRGALEGSVETAKRLLAVAADLGAHLSGEPHILEVAFDSRVRT